MQSYGTLKSFIADFLARNDLTTQITTFITLTEQRMSRELDIALLERVARASVAQGQQFVSLPTDLRSIREVAYVDGNTRRALHYLSPAQLDERKRSTTTSELAYYSITANDLELLATPSKALTLEIVYNEGVAALTDSEPTNTVLARHGDCYLQGALHQAFSFLQDEQRAQYHDALFTRAMAEIKKDSDRQRFGTADLQIRRGISDGGGGTGMVSTSSSTGGTTGATGPQGPAGPQGPQGPQGPAGADGADGLGWTGGSYDAGTGIVTFTSDDGLDFSTGDLRGSGSGSYTDTDVDTHLNQSTATTGQVLSWNGTDYDWVAQSGGSGDITAVNITAGAGLTGSQNTASGDHTQTLDLATAGIGSGTYGSTSNSTKIDQITVDAYGRVTNVTTGAVSGGSGTPGGSNTQVQYNNNGSFGGDSTFTFNASTDTLTVKNIEVTGSGSTNTISSSSDVVLDAGNRVTVEGTVPFRLPNLTTTQRNAISAQAGDMVFNTSTNAVNVYNGSSWVAL